MGENNLESKQATEETQRANDAVLAALPFSDDEDFRRVRRGFIATREEPLILGPEGTPVWDLNEYDFLQGEAPDTANPSLWRQAQLNVEHGLFEIADGFYQVRGYDLANITFIRGESGWIVIDPLTCNETAAAALALIQEHVADLPVVAVIHTHSHVDHFAGVEGVVSKEDVKAGKVQILAPEGFLEAAVSENVIAGNSMGRRAMYMYGNVLPRQAKGHIDAGLGKGTALGTLSLIAPTDTISETGETRTIDGVEIEFQITPGTEAPAEMNFYFPQHRVLCMAENCTATLHNLYTLRGAQVRDALNWSKYLHESYNLFADRTDTVFASHHWPRWGQEEIGVYLKQQRDLYRYIHDQSMRMANQGYNGTEIAEMLQLPASLQEQFYNHGYYGTVNHNAKAVYQRYVGWFDGNPANLHSLPTEEASRKYVDFMGGAQAVLEKARESYVAGEYRWVAQVVNHVVFADPSNEVARALQADALEQMGYQAESGPWRDFYLSGAQELRQGVDPSLIPDLKQQGKDIIPAMTVDMLLDAMAVRLNAERAEGKTLTLNMDFTDTGLQYVLGLENSAFNYTSGALAPDADATLHITRTAMDALILGADVTDKFANGEISIEGNAEAMGEIFGLLDDPDPAFNIVTP
ncbi:MAG: MBL fold metallo-hydrolase [Actinomycetia bacterium]|nr:MBL fold metallo-hydrolase [Actinomycetes bacterium]